jgi:hypothetical protein
LGIGCGGTVEVAEEQAAFEAIESNALAAGCRACDGDCGLCDGDSADRMYRCTASDLPAAEGCWWDGSVLYDEGGGFICLYCAS